MRSRRVSSIATAILAICAPLLACAYTLTTVDSGKPVRWRYGEKLNLAGNPTTASGFPEESFRKAVITGLQQWKAASRGNFDFDYWQGTDSSIFEANLDQNGLSSIFFASNSKEATDPNVLGFTQVWYNPSTGDLIETDVILNDRDFTPTTSPTDSTYQGHGYGMRPKVHLGNVVTHELGHAAGLSHSGDLNSSMLYVEFLDQFKLGCDDVAGIRHLYSGYSSGDGALSGTILTPSGEAAAGVQVTAVSKARGVPVGTAHTDQNGLYHFASIPAGEIGLLVSRFQGGASSIPDAFHPKPQTICRNSAFPVQFITDGDPHAPKLFSIQGGGTLPSGAYRIQCNELTSTNGGYPEGAPEMVFDSGKIGISQSYSFVSSGEFQVVGSGFLFLSPVTVSLEARDAGGRLIPVTTTSPLYSSESGFRIPDTRITGYATGRITLRATPTGLGGAPVPIPAVSQSLNPYYVLSFHSSAEDPDPRCLPRGPVQEYTSPPGAPIRYASTTSSRDRIGFCAQAQASARIPGSDRRTSASAGGILGWFLPFLLLFSIRLYSKLRRARLNAR